MKRIVFATLTSAAAGALAMPAFAGNLKAPTPEPQVTAPAPVAPTPAPFNWTGGYAGVGLGYSHASTSPDQGSGSSGIGSLYGGYNYQVGNFVVGGEVGVNRAHTGYGGADPLGTSYDAKLRLGVPTNNMLIYGALGAAHAEHVHGVGKMVGLGVDYALTDKILVGGEANYTQYNNGAGNGVDLKNTTLEARVSFKF